MRNNTNRNHQHQKNNNRFRRNNNNNNRGRNNGRFSQDEDSNFVTPQQRRHASNQQNKFLDLAKNARQSGERIEYEYYMQHVEHYTRILNLADEQQRMKEESRRREYDDNHDMDDAEVDEMETESTIEEEVFTADEQNPPPASDHAARHHEQRRRKPRVPLRERTTDDEYTSSSTYEKSVSAPKDMREGHISSTRIENPELENSDQPAKKRRGRPKKMAPESQSEENSGASLQHVLPMAKMD